MSVRSDINLLFQEFLVLGEQINTLKHQKQFLSGTTYDLERKIKRLEIMFDDNKLGELRMQVQCGVVTGHKFVFSKRVCPQLWYRFIFICEYCGLQLELGENQLSSDQTKHLRGLGLLLPKEKK